jgi:hypothetical protein
MNELVGEERALLVVKDGAPLHLAGGRVDRVVDGQELACICGCKVRARWPW